MTMHPVHRWILAGAMLLLCIQPSLAQDLQDRSERARLLIIENRYGEARDLLQAAGPDSLTPSENHLLGLALQAEHAFEDAIAPLLRADSLDSGVRYALARSYDETGRPDRAASEYRAAWRLNPFDRAPALALGRLLADNGRWPEARDVYQDLARSDSGNAFVHAQLGTVYRALHETDQAIVQYEIAHRITPSSVRVALSLSSLYMGANLLTSARRVIDRTLQEVPDNWQLLERSGEIALKQEEFEVALETFKRALDQGDSSAFALRGAGIGYYMLHQSSAADSLLMRSWRADSSDGITAVYLGMANINLERYDRALYFLNAAAPKLGQFLVADVNTHVGYIYEQTKKPEDAIRQYEAVLTLAPRRVETLLKLAKLYEDQGERAEAIRCYRRLLAMADPQVVPLQQFINERIRTLQTRR